jgi:hypothetical protein
MLRWRRSRHTLAPGIQQWRPDMAIGGITPKQKLKMTT